MKCVVGRAHCGRAWLQRLQREVGKRERALLPYEAGEAGRDPVGRVRGKPWKKARESWKVSTGEGGVAYSSLVGPSRKSSSGTAIHKKKKYTSSYNSYNFVRERLLFDKMSIEAAHKECHMIASYHACSMGTRGLKERRKISFFLSRFSGVAWWQPVAPVVRFQR